MNAPDSGEVVVFDPSNNDILMGAGHNKAANEHLGNICFKALILVNLQRYMEAKLKREKSKIVESIIRFLAKRGTRFLRRRYRHGLDGYVVVTDRRAIRDKVAHAIRDCYYSPKEAVRRPEEEAILVDFIAEQDEETKKILLAALNKQDEKERESTLQEVASSLVGLSKRKNSESEESSGAEVQKKKDPKKRTSSISASSPSVKKTKLMNDRPKPMVKENSPPIESYALRASHQQQLAHLQSPERISSQFLRGVSAPSAPSLMGTAATAESILHPERLAAAPHGSMGQASMFPSASTFQRDLGATLPHTRRELAAQSAPSSMYAAERSALAQELLASGSSTAVSAPPPITATEVLLAERALLRKQLLNQMLADEQLLASAGAPTGAYHHQQAPASARGMSYPPYL